jgi:hypothetical protein
MGHQHRDKRSGQTPDSMPTALSLALTAAPRLDPVCKRIGPMSGRTLKKPQVCRPSPHWRMLKAVPHLTPLHHILPHVVPSSGNSRQTIASPTALPYMQRASEVAHLRSSSMAQPPDAADHQPTPYTAYLQQLVDARTALAPAALSPPAQSQDASPPRLTALKIAEADPEHVGAPGAGSPASAKRKSTKASLWDVVQAMKQEQERPKSGAQRVRSQAGDAGALLTLALKLLTKHWQRVCR